MNPEARAKMALVALIVVLAAMATLSAAPASAGQSWEQSPDCDQSIAVSYLTPHPPLHKNGEGAQGNHCRIPDAYFANAGRRWMNPPAGLVKSRWDWAAMGRQTGLQAFPPTQIAPTGYISYTIHPGDVVPPEKILADPYYLEKINSTRWFPPFRGSDERQKVMDECIFRATVFGIMAKNNPEIAAITDPYQQALKILEVAAVDPNLASMMPHFRGATGMSVEEASQWRQRVVNWLKENQTKNPASFRGWVNWLLEGAKVHSGVVIQVPTPTPERPTPSAEAPELSEWGLKWDAGRKVYVTVDNRYGLPAGSEAGIYVDQKYLKDGQEQRGLIGLKAPIIQKLVEQSWAKGERVLPLMFDPREKEFEIYSIFDEEWGVFTGFKVPGGTKLIAPFVLKDYSRGNFALKSSGERGWLFDFKIFGRRVVILFKSGKLIANRSENVAPGTVLAEIDADLFQTQDILGPGNVYQKESNPSAIYPVGALLLTDKPTFLSQ